MSDCYFVSDLHLFANRSLAHSYLEIVEQTALRSKTFVLGGDIFDFRWAQHRSPDRAVDAAIDWLGELAHDCPKCQFHFLLGNHDYYQPFINRLEALEHEAPNLAWHRFYYRLRGAIFLHGDVADRLSTAASLAASRSRWLNHRKRGPLLSRLYDVVIATQVHRPLPYVVYRRRTVARRILHYLRDIGQGPEAGVEHVYFGHTHRELSHFRYGGLTFHNGGAPIKGTRFRIVEVAG